MSHLAHHTKDKGDLGVFKAQVAIAQKGWTILHPMTEHAPFDLVAYKDGKFKRIQVKYRAATRGRICLKFETMWSNKNGLHRIKFDLGQIDVVCIYCPDIDQCCFIDTKEIDTSVTVRIKRPKNNQIAKVKMFEDYQDFA